MLENLTEKASSFTYSQGPNAENGNILKALYLCSNGDFKLLVVLPFIIAGDLKAGIFLWITTVVLTDEDL